MTIDILGYVGGVFIVISFLPQLIKSWKTKSTKDISLCRYIIYVTGLFLYIIYAWEIKSLPVFVMNFLSIFLAGGILYFKVKYK